MSGFVDTMHLKGMADEDIWLARRDRELKAAMERKKKARAGQQSKQQKADVGEPKDQG